jgi:cell wall-associated NlpC family hydrolase
MRHLLLLIILFSLVLSACRSSARFSTQTSTKSDQSSRGQDHNEESSSLNSYIQQWLHTPYKYGGMSKSGVDCSGFSSIVMRDVFDIDIPRTAEDQYNSGEKIRDGWRKPGDLVFFKNVRGRGVDHVGIFLGNNRFVHASTKKGVIVSDLDEDYYHQRYVGSCRFAK